MAGENDKSGDCRRLGESFRLHTPANCAHQNEATRSDVCTKNRFFEPVWPSTDLMCSEAPLQPVRVRSSMATINRRSMSEGFFEANINVAQM